MSDIIKLNNKDIQSIKALLNSFELPNTDLESVPVCFWGIKDNGKLLATGALEIYATNAILRSVAVHRNFQKLGFGKLITLYLENEAAKRGIKNLYLLTTTAELFFRKLNYVLTGRDLCPNKIKASEQFRELCPKTAVCLFKSIRN